MTARTNYGIGLTNKTEDEKEEKTDRQRTKQSKRFGNSHDEMLSIVQEKEENGSLWHEWSLSSSSS